jgi:hypothetical protein
VKNKYQLDPSSKKFICPKCDKKRFVRMIDELGNYLSAEFGRCDRSNSCGYFNYPQNANSDIKLDLALQNVRHHPKKDGPPSEIPDYYVEQSQKEYGMNAFYQYLITLFAQQDIQRVFALYKVGTSRKWNGATVFWQISVKNQVRTAKVIKYDPKTGKRIKTPRPLMTWAHTLLNFKEFNLKQVLFGEHLLSHFPNQTVCIVESEKTAIIMAIKHPNYLWLATGGIQEFKAEKIKVLMGRNVVVFPDTDFHYDWSQRAKSISKQFNLNLIVSEYLVNCTISLDQSKGYDLADLDQINVDIVSSIKKDSESFSNALLILIQRNPCLSDLIRVFDLEVF